MIMHKDYFENIPEIKIFTHLQEVFWIIAQGSKVRIYINDEH